MTFEEFRASIAAGGEPPAELSAPLRALWLDGKGDWAAAHGTVADLETKAAARVHAARAGVIQEQCRIKSACAPSWKVCCRIERAERTSA